MSNDYSSDPPIATAGQLIVISDKINDLGKSLEKLAEMPQKLDRMNMQLEQLNKEHQQTRNDLSQTRDNLQDELDRAKSNFKSELKQVRNDIEPKFKEFDLQIRVLSESKTKIDSITNLVRWGGIALISAFGFAWNNQTAKTDMVNTQTMANSQSIEVLEKQSDQTLRILEEIRNKQYERNYRESANETNR
ncbi:hypothetical protein E0H83_01145 [Acinetobacter terrestris]|uniref:hypothetical protein n=1 Tax=Acinetobacter terrestris TaxID=2529843 RepID=UPI0010394908|nr:hypothetical protein [Acinetobacter terrestris]TCB48376.1 hypothetical protein E0H83_01145 [Acinetobacter terrestris]